MVLLSIVVPVFNRQSGINALIVNLEASLEYEKYKKLVEVIVVDDFSSPEITLASDGVTLVRNSGNLGAPPSRCLGYQLSKGQFVHFHDSDDGFSSLWLKQVMESILNGPDFDLLVTGRNDIADGMVVCKEQKYFHRNADDLAAIKRRLIYRNCMGPLGGVTFSRKVLSSSDFKSLASSQDWYMYLMALERSSVLISRPDIQFTFNTGGDDRISKNALKKVLGFLQLSKTTADRSIFGKKIRFFYLFTCRKQVADKGGLIEKFYKKYRATILFYYLVITVYWRLT